MNIHDLPESDIVYVAGQPMPRIIDDGEDKQYHFTLLQEATFTFGEHLDKVPDITLNTGETLTGYYQSDVLGDICISSNERGPLTMPVAWVKIEPLCEDCKKHIGAYEVAGMMLCSACIAPPAPTTETIDQYIDFHAVVAYEASLPENQ